MQPIHLFSPVTFRDLTLRNRIVVSPMCQYSSEDGFASDWHLVHLGSRAVGGAGLVFTEAAAVTPNGRISPQDLGIWKDEHLPALQRVTEFVKAHGAAAGIQLAHAGRKASTAQPWRGGQPVTPDNGGWGDIVGPSAIPFSDTYPTPRELSIDEIHALTGQFEAAAHRALAAGFQVVEIHAAHGYLIQEFLSPISNHREDEYGGSFDNRTRLLCEIAVRIRNVWPQSLPVFVRISATDWVENGWDLPQSIELAAKLKTIGIDLIDCSSGGNVARAPIPVGPGFQTPFAAAIRREANLPTGAVGMITSAVQADHIIRTGQADVVLLARELLRDPYWPLHAARELNQPIQWPVQYERAK